MIKVGDMTDTEYARSLQIEIQGMQKAQGGLTPQQLQDFTAQWWIRKEPKLLNMAAGQLISNLFTVIAGENVDERDIAAFLMSYAMVLGYKYAFDAYTVTSDALDFELDSEGTVLGHASDM